MRILYIADDGTEFDNEVDCEIYEDEQKLDRSRIHIYNNIGEEITEKWTDEVYGRIWYISIADDEAYQNLLTIAKYYGWCDLEDIPGPGNWQYIEGWNLEHHWKEY